MLICDCCWMSSSLPSAQSFDHFLYRTPTPWRGWASGRTSRNPWHSVTGIVFHVQWHIECRYHWSFSPPHWMLPCPGLTCNHLHYMHHLRTRWVSLTFRGAPSPWPSSSSPWQHPQYLDGLLVLFLQPLEHLHCSPGPINWTCQAELNVPCICIGMPLFVWSSSKEQDSFPWCQDHSFGDSFFETTLEHVGN